MNRLWQKKGLIKNSLILMALVMLWLPVQAQHVKTMTIGGDGGEIFLLPEVGGIIVESDAGPKLEMVMPSDQRPGDYKVVDIQAGDIIKMFNGKSMKTVSAIEEAYEVLEIGDDVKFGVRRDKDIFIVKFAKMDPKDASGTMMVKSCPASDVGDLSNVSTDLVDLGLILSEKDGEISVVDVITEMPSAFIGTQPENGDRLVKIQSDNISSTKQLTQIYSNINANEKASLTILRGVKEINLQFIKPKSGSGGASVKIIRKQEQ